jgi:hypothetical protein
LARLTSFSFHQIPSAHGERGNNQHGFCVHAAAAHIDRANGKPRLTAACGTASRTASRANRHRSGITQTSEVCYS